MQSIALVSSGYPIKEEEVDVDLEYCFKELSFVALAYQPDWATHLKELLFAIQGQADWHSDRKLVLSEVRKRAFERCYNEIIMLGIWHPANRLLWGCMAKANSTTLLSPSSRIIPLEFPDQGSRVKKLVDYLRVNKLKILKLMWETL